MHSTKAHSMVAPTPTPAVSDSGCKNGGIASASSIATETPWLALLRRNQTRPLELVGRPT